MNEPWGLSGPEFLRIYLVGLFFALLFALAVRIIVRTGNAETRPTGGTIRPSQLTVSELAYLAGGARRVVETAVARLIDQGRIRPSRKGTVRVVEGSTPTDPLDRAVLSDVTRYGDRTIGLLVDKVSQDDAVRGVGDSLARKGLLVGEAAARARWGALPLVVLFVIGAARWINGISDGRPVGWLSLALLATGLATVLVYRKTVPMRTYSGERVLREATPRGRRVPSEEAVLAGAAGVVGVVALSGLGAHPDEEINTALASSRNSGSYDGGSSSGGSGSGCSSGGGGGGCGGGGCGG
ncbi:TIGR04222 domain-containing membrane protein [Actinokineospora sp. HUAS TT18]|uniref:TIGR04222 domain-containing membrane protein n=1 Tax=Actinokineospora sp. HUAS TT18 TaxID=3447451 RepID=UPI003F528F03